MSVLQAQPIDYRFDTTAGQIGRDEAGRRKRRGHLYVVPDTATPIGNRTQTSAGVRTVRPPKARPAPAGSPAITVRGVLMTLVAFILALGIGGFAGWLAQPEPYSGETAVTSVSAGESLWTIASNLGIEGRPIDEIVDDIRQLNHLESSHLDIGQPLVVPVR
ncbi:MAG: LysM peptidoglycan-binding domain-containing protein [Actinomycetaceae bacterium]|nr:LysM peptidoglycan-binding domain-containing protein [Actinomycetaceae bacterium]